MKKLLKILVSIMVCLVIVGCQKKDDVKLNVSPEFRSIILQNQLDHLLNVLIISSILVI